MTTQKLAELRAYVARIAQVPQRDVELVHGTSQDAHDIPEYIDVRAGTDPERLAQVRSRLEAAGIHPHPYDHDGTLSCLTYEVEAAAESE